MTIVTTQNQNPPTLIVKVGNRNLLGTAVIHMAEIEVSVTYLDLQFIFRFKSDDTNQARYQGKVEDNKKLVFELMNHKNVLGEGVFEPMEVGFINNKKIYMTYFCNTVEEKNNKRRLEVSFFEAE